jgi:hypothetical protein
VKRLLTLFCTLFFALVARASEGGSTYSMFGIGDLRYYPNARSAGMGYTGIGLPSTNYINAGAPATWSRINRTRLEAGFLFEGIRASDGTNKSYRTTGNFNGVLIAVPISTPRGIVFVGGFTPYSNVNYNVSGTLSSQGIDYAINNLGSGGIGQGQAGFSYAPTQDLSFGASFNYLSGTLTNTSSFQPTLTTFVGGKTTESLTAKGITVTLGGMYTGLGSISEALRTFSVGFVITTRGNLKTERQFTYEFLQETDTSTVTQSRITIPLAYGFGLAYQAGERYVLAADYNAQQWGQAKFNGIDPQEIRNSFRFGFGGERIPSKEMGAYWLDRISYRLGFSYHSTYYKINGQPINEWLITGGFAFPLSGETRLNMALEYGGRGTNRVNLIKDNIFRLSLSLNIGELWFVRYEEE